MATRCANISPSKRSFDDTSPLSCAAQYHAQYAVTQTYEQPPPPKRRSSVTHHNTMLSERTTIMSDSFPSFMSVFGSEEPGFYRPVDVEEQPKLNENAFPLMTPQSTITKAPQRQPSHTHRDSINSLFSDSTESSPTTTSSTFDSPIVSDSVSSSPESATSMASSTPFRLQAQPIAANAAEKDDTRKNMRKLTLDMNVSSLRRPATSGGPADAHTFSAPASPLKEPLKSARKKPTNLTIRTPGYNQLTFPRTGTVPATPGQRQLHHMQSSPSLATLTSPRGPPAGGMFLPLPTLNTQHIGQNSSSSNGSSILANSMPDLREENESIPKSQEAPERGYTEGPVCVYDCGVYLYLEPTAAEASEFDIVINVAKEIKNPFKQKAGEGTVMSVWRNETHSPRTVREPQTAISEYSFKSAWEYPHDHAITPTVTTPTQSSFGTKKQPEYVHVRWDHNSEILDDLYPLCKIIDDRVAQGKKVLVHCQLGVSRSASLIIAYGLFKNYQSDFHSMYTAVKERSRWVGPNMSLIYQLTDFKNKLNRGGINARDPHPDWFAPSPDGPLTPVAPTPKPSVQSSAQLHDSTAQTLRLNKALPPVPLFPKNETAPPTESIREPTIPAPPPPTQKTATVKRAASKPLPFRERFAEMSIPAHKPRPVLNFAMQRPPSAIMDLAMKDVPSTPSIFSPRVTEFTATPFNIRGAGDLSTPGNRQSKDVPVNFSWLPLRKDPHRRTASTDPRSPHQIVESQEIYRNIDDYL